MIWGSAFPAIKLIVDDLGTLWAAAMRVAIGFAAVAPFFLLKPQWPRNRAVAAAILVVALLNMVIPFILLDMAEGSVHNAVERGR